MVLILNQKETILEIIHFMTHLIDVHVGTLSMTKKKPFTFWGTRCEGTVGRLRREERGQDEAGVSPALSFTIPLGCPSSQSHGASQTPSPHSTLTDLLPLPPWVGSGSPQELPCPLFFLRFLYKLLFTKCTSQNAQ